jgi:ProP effector
MSSTSPTPESSAAEPVPAIVDAAAAGSPDAGAVTEATPKAPDAHSAAEGHATTSARLAELFPALFKGQAKPLKLRIQVDIQERAPGEFSKQALSAFFRRYTGATSYLLSVAKGTQRFDLDGQPAGELTEEHRKVAADELARRRTNANAKREQAQAERRNRAGLLRDFETTKLTTANFCALKGVAPEALDGLLAQARAEALEDAQNPRKFEPHGRRDGRGEGRGEGRRDGRPQGDRPTERGAGQRDGRGPDRRGAGRGDGRGEGRGAARPDGRGGERRDGPRPDNRAGGREGGRPQARPQAPAQAGQDTARAERPADLPAEAPQGGEGKPAQS